MFHVYDETFYNRHDAFQSNESDSIIKHQADHFDALFASDGIKDNGSLFVCAPRKATVPVRQTLIEALETYAADYVIVNPSVMDNDTFGTNANDNCKAILESATCNVVVCCK